jgi:hypothetical protein
VQLEEGLDLASHFATGGLGIKALPEHGPEGAATRVYAVAAVGLLGSFGEKVLRQPRAETLFELAEGIGADLTQDLEGAAMQRSQALLPGGEGRGMKGHVQY